MTRFFIGSRGTASTTFCQSCLRFYVSDSPTEPPRSSSSVSNPASGQSREQRLTTRLELPLDRATVFDFFSNTENLGVVTPPELHFRIRTATPIAMREGALIDYTIRLWGVSLGWRTRIARWNPPAEFTDEQLRGPYKTWVHNHRFIPIPGGTAIEDDVVYELPLGWLGTLALPLVQRQLARIFAYRSQAVRAHCLPGHRLSAE